MNNLRETGKCKQASNEDVKNSGTQAIDPVCGMKVSADSKHRHVHEESEYLFCCASCREKFIAAPGQYLESGEANAP
jgi:YHS domain-containing protein